MRVEIPVKTFEVDEVHEICAGRYRPTGSTLLTNPPQYPHECNRCGHKEIFKVMFPYIETRKQHDPIINYSDR